MTTFSSLQSARSTSSHSSLFSISGSQQRTATTLPHERSHLLPARPASIPAAPARSPLSIGSVHSPLEREADAMAERVAGGSRQSTPRSADLSFSEAPLQVHQARASAGRPLDHATRSSMEPSFGADLSSVRIHTDAVAAAATDSVQAKACAVGRDIFFNSGRYDPQSGEGKRLLAHELSHTVQQSGGSTGRLSSSGLALHREPDDKKKKTDDVPPGAKPKSAAVTVPVPPSVLSGFQLTPPSLLQPQKTPSFFSPGQYSLGGASGTAGQSTSPITPAKPNLFPPPVQLPPSQPGPLAPSATPGQQTGGGSGASGTASAPKAPDRVSFVDVGQLSIGARIGFPDLDSDTKPGDPPSALKESLKKGEILNFMLTGEKPSEYSIDPGKLVGALWGIFSTQIDPSLAAKIASGMASKPKGKGLTFELDTTILLDLGGKKPGGGGGATLTVNW